MWYSNVCGFNLSIVVYSEYWDVRSASLEGHRHSLDGGVLLVATMIENSVSSFVLLNFLSCHSLVFRIPTSQPTSQQL
jgi:hypothetical protein